MLPGKNYPVSELLSVAWRGRWLLLVPLVVVSLATVAVVQRLPDRYRSQTLVIVVPQRVPTNYVRPTVTAHINDRLQMIAQQILSRTDLEQIITKFNLYPKRRQTWMLEDVVAAMRKDISLQVVKGNAFRLEFSYSDPATAQKVTAQLASLFIQENLRNRALLSDDTTSFLKTQLEDTRRRLEGEEAKLAKYQREHADELPSQLRTNIEGLRTAQQQLQSLAEAINQSKDRVVQLQGQIADQKALMISAGPAVGSDGRVSPNASPAEQLAAAQAALKALLLTDTPAHPDVVRMQKVIDTLEDKVKEDAALGPTAPLNTGLTPDQRAQQQQLDNLQLQLDTTRREVEFRQNEVTRLKKTIAEYQAHIDAVPMRESDLATLTRNYSTLQDVYRGLLMKQEDAQIAANLERRQIGEQFRVVDPADRPGKPYSPNRTLYDLIGVLAGLGLGVGLVAFREYRDHALRSETDIVDVLSLPVLALVPVLEDPLRLRRVRRALWYVLAGAPAIVAVVLVLFWYVGSMR